MKKLFIISFLITTGFIFSQTKKIEPGVYVSKEKGQSIRLIINADSTYDLSVFYGKYSIENDTIHFVDREKIHSSFEVTPIKNNANSNKLKLSFKDNLMSYYSSTAYIGTQEEENSRVVYKSFNDLAEQNGAKTDSTVVNIEIDKVKYLYLVETTYQKNSISKFLIGNDVNGLEILYNPYSLKNMQLNGYVDKETNKLVVTDGKLPIIFNFEKAAISDEINELKPLEVKQEKDWLKNNGFEDVYATAAATDDYEATPNYVFKYSVPKTYSEAKKVINKTPNKFLIVSFDNGKNAKKDFDTFIKEQESTLTNYMYDAYNSEYDHYEFYFASNKDKNILSKYNIKSSNEILFFNANGDLLYHTKGTLTEKAELFGTYGSFFTELENTNKQIQFDNIINNSKANTIEILKALKSAAKSDAFKNQTDEVTVVAPPKYDASDHVKVDIKETDDVVVDTAAAVAYSDYDYNLIKDKENLYSLKASKEIVNKKWQKIIDYYSKNKVVDKDFIYVLKSELTNTGFSNKLFGDKEVLFTDTDYKLLDYVIANYNSIEKNELEVADTETTSEEDYDYQSPISTDLSNVFYNNTNINFNPEKKNIVKVMDYYEKYLTATKDDYNVMQSYLSALKENAEENNSKYISTYENYFNSVVKGNSNLIEDLDNIYTKNNISNTFSWEEFKESFSDTANDVAWYVVEKSSDSSAIKKAIKWSETSLLLKKDVHYCLDTLAQLYYKNGEKQKAIQFEQKAIEASKSYPDGSYQLEEYEKVLEKMKNGTY